MKTLISTDTSCRINPNVFDGYEISVFPLNVIIDGKEYLDGVTINQEQLKEAMRANKSIKTSTPPLGEIIEYFEGLFAKGYEHIIHFTISSKLSSMNSLFETVAEQNFKGKITVVDSYSLCSPMLAYVFYAYEQTNLGVSPENIKNAIMEQRENNLIMFIPENLTALKNGGRISPAIAVIGNALGIKPVIVLKDGQLDKDGMTRKERKTFSDYLENFAKQMPPAENDYTIVAFDANERILANIMESAKAVIGDNVLILGGVPINVCAHCGPGTIGLLATPRMGGKSLAEYIK